MSTWIVEAPEQTWASAEATVGSLTDETLVSYMKQLWPTGSKTANTIWSPIIQSGVNSR